MFAAICKSRLSAPELLLNAKKWNNANQECPVQLLDMNAAFSTRTLCAAEKLALDAIDAKQNVSGRIEVEFLLWLACTPHVKKAVENAGVKNGTRFVLAMIGGSEGKFSHAVGKIGAELSGSLPAEGKHDLTEIEKMALSRITG